jgi:hypothetical protein
MYLVEVITENAIGLGGALVVFVAISSLILYLNRIYGRKTPLLFSAPADYPFLRDRSENEQLLIMASSVQNRVVKIRLLIPFSIFSLVIATGCFLAAILNHYFFAASVWVPLIFTALFFGPLAGFAARSMEIRLLATHMRGEIEDDSGKMEETA